MTIIGVRRGLTSIAIPVVLLLQISPLLAAGKPDAQLATTQGSRFPGVSVPSHDTAKDNRRGPVDVSFTKWRTAQIPPPPAVTVRSLFAGIVGGDLGAGDFVGEVLDRKVSTPCSFTVPPCAPETPATITGSIVALQAIYEVQAGTHSFTALIQGGTNGVTSAALLNGVVLAGWRTGAQVHVAFQTISTCTDRDGDPHGPCFQGTIRVERAPEE
jgi:hypothetical protein